MTHPATIQLATGEHVPHLDQAGCCVCEQRCCQTVIDGQTICICQACPARTCGLHTARGTR